MNTNRLVRLLKVGFPGASRTEIKQFIRGQITQQYMQLLSENTLFYMDKGVLVRRRYNYTIDVMKDR